MPPQGIKEQRVLCPLCSKEIAAGYMWLHKKQYCPMRPGRQEEIKAEAMGLQVVPPEDTKRGGMPRAITPVAPSLNFDNKFSNIIPINLMEEYNNMVKVMQKKKEEEVDIGEEYQCGGCNTTFHGKKEPKHCPECGIEFG